MVVEHHRCGALERMRPRRTPIEASNEHLLALIVLRMVLQYFGGLVPQPEVVSPKCLLLCPGVGWSVQRLCPVSTQQQIVLAIQSF